MFQVQDLEQMGLCKINPLFLKFPRHFIQLYKYHTLIRFPSY